MHLVKTDTKADLYGMLLRDTDVPCPVCQQRLYMQGFLYWCPACLQGWHDNDPNSELYK